MNSGHIKLAAFVLFAGGIGALAVREDTRQPMPPPGRSEVVFWHFWGGQHGAIVDEIAARFNQSQDEYFVRAVAMPGNNLELKFFLAVTGGDPPDLVNQDDPIVADWAHRIALTSLRQLATPAEYEELQHWLVPAARELGSYNGELYALCNGLDIRALYYDATVLAEFGLEPPTTIAELDRLATTIAPPDQANLDRFGYLPDPRRLWAWGIVFGGEFYDPLTNTITADHSPVVAALEWMAGYSRRYGSERVAAFRKGDQALAGAAFPLLQGRYVALMDGQWRVAEIAAHQQALRDRGETPHEYGVAPLPAPPGGRQDAGWVNGNFFVVPRGAKNPAGAWAFMKFWSGFAGHEAEAARACAAGGWIPASTAVVHQTEFQEYLRRYPLFEKFVRLAASPNQAPTPSIPVASLYYSEVVRAAELAMYQGAEPRNVLRTAADRVRDRLFEVTHGE